MRCEECKDQLGSFLDNELEEAPAAGVRSHLSECGDCAIVCEELSAILVTCSTESEAELAPPNSTALWVRISNTIESEQKPAPLMQVEKKEKRLWRFSLGQLVTAAAGIVILSSLVTFVGIYKYRGGGIEDQSIGPAPVQSTFEKILAKAGLVETPQQIRDRKVREQEAAVNYWNNRVQARRMQWDAHTREAFDRNLKVINESLDQYAYILQQDPDDGLSAEMFDSVLNDKMNLLRDFSDF
jgi:hypothetical protein